MDGTNAIHSKILTREELLARRHVARQAGMTVVQCHGCFDIVHPGHIRHLQHAARQGDLLLVSITADVEMLKGEHRPLIPQELRAEGLAALDCVDWVYVNPHPTAQDLLEEIRPDIYIKGREYESNDDPRFHAEREAVERHGGRILFSSGDIVFSSTALIAAMEHNADPFHARLRQLIDSHDISLERLHPIVDAFSGARVCIVGETIIDTYVMCDRPDVAGEGPIMSLRPLEQISYDGGAAIIARHLAALGARPTLITALPRTAQAEAFRQRLAVEGVEVRWIEIDSPMVEKQRFLVGAQKVMKIDHVHTVSLDAARQRELIHLAREAAEHCTAGIVADFGCGLLTPRTLADLCATLRPHLDILSGDVSGPRSGLLKMRAMDLLCPTEAELRNALNNYDDSLNAVVWRLMETTGARRAIITLGGDGAIAFDRLPDSAGGEHAWRQRVHGDHVPALAPHALDGLGCGDALLTASTLSLASGATLIEACFLGSIAAAIEAGRLGNEPISANDLRRAIRRYCSARLTLSTSRPAVRIVS